MSKYESIESGIQKLEDHTDLSPEHCDEVEKQLLENIGNAQRDVEDGITHEQALAFSKRVMTAIQICKDRNYHNLSEE